MKKKMKWFRRKKRACRFQRNPLTLALANLLARSANSNES